MKQAIVLSLICLSLAAPAVFASDVGAGTYSCSVLVGSGNPVLGVSLGTPVANVGGCDLVQTTVTTVATSITAPAGCSIVEDTTGDGFSNANVTVGSTVAPGDVFTVCDIGVVQANVTLVLGTPPTV